MTADRQRWWAREDLGPDVADALSHLNHARTVPDPSSPQGMLDVCDALFRGLNRFTTALRAAEPREGEAAESDTSALRRLLRHLGPEGSNDLLAQRSVRRLAEFTPPIEDHYILRDYLLSQTIPPEVRGDAQATHVAFRRRVRTVR